MTEKRLELKAKMKKKRPKFRRQEFKRKNLKDTWRKPRGIHSKMKRREKGKGRMPSPGYGSPNDVKGLDRSGFREILVRNPEDLKSVDGSKEIAVISRSVGKKKRLEMLEKAEKMDIRIKNN